MGEGGNTPVFSIASSVCENFTLEGECMIQGIPPSQIPLTKNKFIENPLLGKRTAPSKKESRRYSA